MHKLFPVVLSSKIRLLLVKNNRKSRGTTVLKHPDVEKLRGFKNGQTRRNRTGALGGFYHIKKKTSAMIRLPSLSFNSFAF